MNEQWREQMRAKMEGYGEQPPCVDWTEIERAVAGRRKSERRRTAVLWSRRAAAAVVAVLIVTAAVRIALPGHEPQSAQPATQTLAQSKSTGATAITSPDGAARPATPARPFVPAGRVAQSQLMAQATVSATAASQHSPAAPESSSPLPTEPATPTHPASPAQPANPTPSSEKKTILPSTDDPFPPAAKRRRSTRVAMGAYFANTPSSQTTIGSPGMMFAFANPIGNYYSDMSGDAVYGSLDKPDNETTVTHSRPVRVGLSLRYGLSPRWSVETGLTYTYLHSEITHRAGHATHTDDQRLHYVGIPVGLSYSVWRTSRIGVYASASVMAEKCVGGTETISRPQFSAGASLGAELSLGGGIGLYVEPGVTHRFDNHSTVPTIYKDRPTDFNLDIGLRLNLK